MKVHSYGKIINISSIMGTLAWSGKGHFSLAPYSASKAGLISLTKSFALPLASYNITVNAICPAFVDTPLVAPLKNDPDIYNDIVSRTPMGRFANCSEISAPALFLASDMSSFITGHALLVDGGWTTK
jgi:NAD(P)-dependent dehydrogenase (short-subunit alcohol dehydrogenase family)